ncbi:voltage-dependent T-type calcium channel subunit alpha-1G-like isoform X3 [Haliotis cracherodii]|uniref:voltage-dependent T-type calcium channel subunit alpha-1G-like isoform X3 n=1 Tax=Haliotis cracherodii TaxID=6455 RepID=UPI0039E7328B
MMVILLNCLTLGMYKPCDDQVCSTTRCRVLEGFDHFIFAFFAVEMLIKMIAMGICGKDTYLADSWNKLDCFIVLAGAVEYGIDTENLSISAIRTIRVLRPLRAINRIPSMRILVMLLLDTLPMLGNVLLLCFFVFFIFGIIGVQLWAGVLRNRCFLDIGENISYVHNLPWFYQPKKGDYICSQEGMSGMRTCGNIPPFEFEGFKCNGSAKEYSNNTPTSESCVNWNQYYSTCQPGDRNPFRGAISFDNIGLAWVAIFQVISLESWVNIMYYVQDAHSFWDWTYFVALIVIGSFFMINLCLVVIATQFSETKKRETERMLQERKRYQSSSTIASNSEPGGCYSELLKLLVHYARRAKRKLIRYYFRHRGKRQRKVNPEKAISLRKKKNRKKGIQTVYLHQPHHQHHHHHHLNIVTPDIFPSRAASLDSAQAPRASPEASDVDPISSPRRPNFLMLPSNNNSLNPSSESLNTLPYAAEALTPTLFKPLPSPNHLTANYSLSRTSSFNCGAMGSAKNMPSLPEVLAAHGAKNAALAASNLLLNVDTDTNKLQSLVDKGLFADHLLVDIVGEKRVSCVSQSECDTTHNSHTHSEYELSDSDKNNDSDSDFDWKEESEPTKKPTNKRKCNLSCIAHCINKFTSFMVKIVESKFFQRGILGAILLNTLSMGVEYHKQPDELTLILEYSNVAFSILFGAEMLSKLLAYGLYGYISDGFNVFDGFIVILSIVELAQGGASGLSVLRTFRLLRILKLVRFLPALRRQLVVMLRTMDNVATFFALLLLFMFIFSILGMNLFGGKFCEREDGSSCTCADLRSNNVTCFCDRVNFDSTLWSLVTVFQVLTQEDWNTVLYNGMAKTSPWASLYFIALMTFGNYVLFNLLVAILVEGFSTEDDEKKKEKVKEMEEQELEEKEKQRLAENNNIDDAQKEKEKLNSSEVDVKNNKEKEKKMLALPPPVAVTKEDNTAQVLTAQPQQPDGPLNPPIITHTAATPMATPQGSPNESALKDINNKLAVSMGRSIQRSTLSVESERTSTSLSFRGSPRPSPKLRRTSSRGSQRSSSWRLKHRRRDAEKTSLVVDSQSDSGDDLDDDVFTLNQSQSPTYTPGTPRTPNNHGDCNGHPPLNNQRTLSPQNSIKGHKALTPKNSIKSNHSWSRNNSVSSSRSICNSFELSRQNSFTSHRTLNSMGSGASKEEYKPNNLSDPPEVKVSSDKEDFEGEEDPDAIDETDWNCSWLPEPKGCFKTRKEYSLYLMSMDNLLRKVCHHLISRKWFDNSVLFFIALNCITLAMERPDIPPESVERQFLTISNYVFTVIFAIEMVLKVIAKGFFVGKHAYLKSGWNVMDGFLVIISLVDILISLVANSSPRIFGILRVFRLLRTLRPLRVISRAPGLKLVVQTLLSSLRPIGNIVLICCTFFIIFGILGVQLFKGTFYYCKGPPGLVKDIRNRTQCQNDTRFIWINRKYNFDNLGQALMALFVLASKDGWVSIMHTGLDAVGIDEQPIENYNEWRLLYFISFLLLVGFFVLNMFVGVVVENFHKCRESQEMEERAVRAAKRQQKLERKRKSEDPKNLSELSEPPYWAPYSRPRLLIHTVINSKYFDLAIAGVIGLNVITMAMEYYMMPQELEFALKIFNYFFTSVFILEAIMKIVALGFLRYMRDRWNQLDMLIVILSIFGIILEEMKTYIIPINPTIIRVMRVLRIARVLKLLKMAKGIRALLDTVIQALPQVGNLGLLFFLLFFIFAALGVELFGRLECSQYHPCEGLGEHAHFRNFGMAFLTLFRVATGDNWNGIMKDTLRDNCDATDNCLRNCCVSPIIAPVYFVVFVLMAQFVLVNVVVAVLMKHLEETYKYKELDDEVEEELRLEMAARNEKQAEMIEMKESHRNFTEDDDEVAAITEGGQSDEKVEDEEIDGDKKSSEKSSQENNESPEAQTEEDIEGLTVKIPDDVPTVQVAPSFTFSVRPPSEEQSQAEDDRIQRLIRRLHGNIPKHWSNNLSPAKIAITVVSMENQVGTVPAPIIVHPCSPSRRSILDKLESPPMMQMKIASPPESRMDRRLLSDGRNLATSSRQGRRPLVKQYSVDIGSGNHLHGSVPSVWQTFEDEVKKAQPKGFSQSHPTLPVKQDSLQQCPEPEFDSPKHRLLKKHMLRSRSSGAKYSRFRDKYLPRAVSSSDTTGTDTGASPLIRTSTTKTSETNITRSKDELKTQQSSGETGSDLDDSLINDWAELEAACDEEVMKITGDDDDDDVRPTLTSLNSCSYASECQEDSYPFDSSNSSSNLVPDSEKDSPLTDSEQIGCHSTFKTEDDPLVGIASLSGVHIQMPDLTTCQPGIDNSSFELGEGSLSPPNEPSVSQCTETTLCVPRIVLDGATVDTPDLSSVSHDRVGDRSHSNEPEMCEHSGSYEHHEYV